MSLSWEQTVTASAAPTKLVRSTETRVPMLIRPGLGLSHGLPDYYAWSNSGRKKHRV